MEFDWDERKRAANFEKHGLDFADVAFLAWETARVLIDDRRDYGEVRYRAMGLFKGRLHFVALHSMHKGSPDILNSGLIHSFSRIKRTQKVKFRLCANIGGLARAVLDDDDARDVMVKKIKSVQRAVDRDNPEWTAADFRRARPVAEVLPAIIAAAAVARGAAQA